MAYILRLLIVILIPLIVSVGATGAGYIQIAYPHILLAIPAYLATLFIQAFVMFFFIGVHKLTTNVFNTVQSGKPEDLHQIFEGPLPSDFGEYLKKTKQLWYQSQQIKRQTVPWAILIIVLGMITFLIGGAYDTGVVSKPIHSGLAYSFTITLFIGVYYQWVCLGKAHKLLRKLKTLYQIPDHQM